MRKDGGDDPDETNGCLVNAAVQILPEDGAVQFRAGEGVGVVTRKGLKLPPGESAINPVPREMIEKAVRSVIGAKGAVVTVSVPDGERIAQKTFNGRLGIEGGISILGTTGIVRPMSEEAVRESLSLELSMCRAEYGKVCAFVTGYAGESWLRRRIRMPDRSSFAAIIWAFCWTVPRKWLYRRAAGRQTGQAGKTGGRYHVPAQPHRRRTA